MSRFRFDPEVVHGCAMQAIDLPKPRMFEVFADAMEAHYPGVLDRSQPWIYSVAGGAMIQMKLFYASLSEYIMIWGTPIGSEGFSGRHFVGFWDTVLCGETWYYAEGQFEKTVYRPGDRIYVGPGQAVGMTFQDGLYAVEYARGAIPLSLPFGLSDLALSCMDLPTVAQTVTLYTDLVAQDLSRRLLTAPHPIGQLAGTAASLLSRVANRATQGLRATPPVKTIPRDNIPLRLSGHKE